MLATDCYVGAPVPDQDTSTTAIRLYYVATALFLLLDVVFDINVRIAFLEGHVGLRAGYYGVCFVCLALVFTRPPWTTIVGAFESLVTLIGLILSFGMRVVLASDAALDGRTPYVSIQEVGNFLLSGSVAYLAWSRGMRALTSRR